MKRLVFIGISLLVGVTLIFVSLKGKLNAPGKEKKAEEKPTRIVALGDMACSPEKKVTEKTCKLPEVAAAVRAVAPEAAILLGDLQYEKGELNNFNQIFDKQWGDLKQISYATAGNHEYYTSGAKGYYQYWNNPKQTGDSDKGYYSFDIGGWHIIALNSNCDHIGGCSLESTQGKWLEADLLANQTQCTIAFWHHPLFASGAHAFDKDIKMRADFWKLLYKHKADLVLNGHEHYYERFAQQNPDGVKDEGGIRQITVGTGGKNLYPFVTRPSTQEAGIDNQFGFLQLDLKSSEYNWAFINTSGQPLDGGTGQCH